MAHNLGWHFSD